MRSWTKRSRSAFRGRDEDQADAARLRVKVPGLIASKWIHPPVAYLVEQTGTFIAWHQTLKDRARASSWSYCGGDKGTQAADIRRARKIAEEVEI